MIKILKRVKNRIKKDPIGNLLLIAVKYKIKSLIRSRGYVLTRVETQTMLTEPYHTSHPFNSKMIILGNPTINVPSPFNTMEDHNNKINIMGLK